MSDKDRLRAKFALAYGRTSADQTCPPLEQIVAWHEKTLAAAQGIAVRGHVAQCERCFALWSGLVDLDATTVSTPQSRARSVRWWHFAAPALALSVVAVSFWIGLFSGPPLPVYSIDIQGGMDVRGGTEQTLLLRDQTLLQIVVTPARAVDEPMAAAAYAVGAGGWSRLAVAPTVTEKGVASLEAVIGQDVIFAPKTQRVLVVIGRVGQLPDGDELQHVLGSREYVDSGNWQGFAIAVGHE